jgi:hypothetical protein
VFFGGENSIVVFSSSHSYVTLSFAFLCLCLLFLLGRKLLNDSSYKNVCVSVYVWRNIIQ